MMPFSTVTRSNSRKRVFIKKAREREDEYGMKRLPPGVRFNPDNWIQTKVPKKAARRQVGVSI